MATKEQQNDRSTGSNAALSSLVVEAVSAAKGSSVEELPLLYHVIEPDALDMLFSGRETGGFVEFQYAGQTVTVHADRTIEVSPDA